MKLSRILRSLLLIVIVCAVVWGAVVFWWTVAEIQPSGPQMVLWLAVVPALLLTIWWASRLLMRRARRKREANEAAAAQGAVVAPSTTSINDAPGYTLSLVACAVCIATGDTPGGLLAASREPATLRLHPSLRDHQGMPLFCGYLDDIDGTAGAESLTAHGLESGQCSDEQARTVALLERVSEPLLMDVMALLPPVQMVESRVVAGVRRDIDAPVRDRVTIRLLVSQGWPQAARQATGDWLLAFAGELGLNAVATTTLEIVPVASGTQVWTLIDRIGRADVGSDEWTILIAGDSLVGDRSVDALQASMLLTSSDRPEGIVPGEGAAGVVFHHGRATGAEDAGLRVTMSGIVRGEAPITSRTREAAGVTAEVLKRAVTSSSDASATAAGVFCDADHRPARAIEARSAVAAAFPDFDTAHDYAALGSACGYLGHVAPLALLASAMTWVREASAPIVALSVSSEQTRVAAVLSHSTSTSHDDGTTPAVAV